MTTEQSTEPSAAGRPKSRRGAAYALTAALTFVLSVMLAAPASASVEPHRQVVTKGASAHAHRIGMDWYSSTSVTVYRSAQIRVAADDWHDWHGDVTPTTTVTYLRHGRTVLRRWTFTGTVRWLDYDGLVRAGDRVRVSTTWKARGLFDDCGWLGRCSFRARTYSVRLR